MTDRLIRRQHADGDTVSEALYSPCERYRYGLRRVWNADAGELLFVMLNPSTATELRNDPTIERCERRARQLGFGALGIVNLFAWRATRPADLKAARDPIGPETDAVIDDWHASASVTLAAWGVHGAHLDRAATLARRLGPLSHLGLTRDGHPRHPLYVSYATEPAPWPAEARYLER
ncbi:DUF1643 domain-containing protein [Litorisediminicola beolgyonensis]|uniref:DUF1643 domain-containing protein n=1 Tax=Litorisediminicola beolgyonensis TaxID=1173614 RepID=A0ABW3ZM97_9RHOB